MKKTEGQWKKINSVTSALATLIMIVLIGWWVFDRIYNKTPEPTQVPSIGWAIAQSGSDPISEGSGLCMVKWHQSHNFGIAITSHKDIKVGDQILIERHTVDYTGSLQYIQYVAKWKPSDTTSW